MGGQNWYEKNWDIPWKMLEKAMCLISYQESLTVTNTYPNPQTMMIFSKHPPPWFVEVLVATDSLRKRPEHKSNIRHWRTIISSHFMFRGIFSVHYLHYRCIVWNEINIACTFTINGRDCFYNGTMIMFLNKATWFTSLATLDYRHFRPWNHIRFQIIWTGASGML